MEWAVSTMQLPDVTVEASINPFLLAEAYVPDGEPHVFGDRVYLYGSHDLADASPLMCSGDYIWPTSPFALAN